MFPYQDPAQPTATRVEDLLARMTLAEKAGLLFHDMIGINADGTLYEGGFDLLPIKPTTDMVAGRSMNHFNLLGAADPRIIAEWHNTLQDLAASTRLGIPVTLSSDPRNGFVSNPATSFGARGFSQWPEPPGLAAIGSTDLAREAADVMRREFLAVGIRVLLGPMADLATEPRWPRVSGTFGEDADLAARMVTATVLGFQGENLGLDSVACMTKHFPGAGPQKDGEDAHFAYGREQVYPGGNIDYHLGPFEAAFAAGTSQVMPYYAMPVGTQWEEAGFGYNRDVVTGLLREQYGFDGIVCTDWGLVTDSTIFGHPFPARAWGVEDLSALERVERILDAGCDQLGGEACPDLVVELVERGRISEERIDVSVRRLLREKFRLGLFDDRRYVDPDAADEIVGNAEFRAAGLDAQRRSLIALTDLPQHSATRIYVEGVDPGTASSYATVVDRPEEADLALLRTGAPFDPREGGFEQLFHQGRLHYTPEEIDHIRSVASAVPTIVDVFLDRPAILTGLHEHTHLLADFGAHDTAVLDVVFGKASPEGALPFELPRAPEQVAQSREDVPRDCGDPLFPFGHGAMTHEPSFEIPAPRGTPQRR